MVEKVLTFFDIFGTQNTFYFEREELFKTPVGGMFSILCIMGFIFSFFFFGQDFYLAKNPKVTNLNKVTDYYEYTEFK